MKRSYERTRTPAWCPTGSTPRNTPIRPSGWNERKLRSPSSICQTVHGISERRTENAERPKLDASKAQPTPNRSLLNSTDPSNPSRYPRVDRVPISALKALTNHRGVTTPTEKPGTRFFRAGAKYPTATASFAEVVAKSSFEERG